MTQYGYDDRDRLISITDAMNRKTQIQYDRVAIGCNVVDKPSMITDPAGRKTQLFYDLRQRLTRVVDANGGVTRYDYNARGDLTGLTDPENHRTQFDYDVNRRLIKRSSPSAATFSDGTVGAVTEVTQYTWDLADRLVKEERGSSNSSVTLVTQYEWDALSRLTRKHLTQQQAGVVIDEQDDSYFTYQPQLDATQLLSANNGVAQLGFHSEAVPPFSTTAYSLAATDPTNPLQLLQNSFTVTPDRTGEIAGITDGSGKTLFTAQFDPAGRMTQIASGDFVAGQNLALSFSYDGFGRKLGTVSTTGLTSAHSYDLLNRLTSLQWSGSDGIHSNLSVSESPTYHPLTGNIQSITREMGTFNYQNDPLDELLSVAYSGTQPLGAAVNQSWKYDFAGNRSGTTTLSNVLLQDDQFKYLPDALGMGSLSQKVDLSTSAIERFGYRADQRLTSYSRDGVETHYYYDALGRRVAKEVTLGSDPAFTQAYAYLLGQDKILLGKAGSGEVFVYLDGQGIDEHLGQASPQGVVAFAVDHLGSVLNGEAAGSAQSFGAFGERLDGAAVSMSLASAPVAYGYTGRQLDPESGFYYYRARMYSSDMGRFVTKDPIGFKGDQINLYGYVMNDPANWIDPSGLRQAAPEGGGRDGLPFVFDPPIPSGVVSLGPVGIAVMGLTYFIGGGPLIAAGVGAFEGTFGPDMTALPGQFMNLVNKMGQTAFPGDPTFLPKPTTSPSCQK